MRTLLIYSALRNNLPAAITETVEYDITNGFVDFNKDYQIGIYVSDVAPSRVRMSGQKYEGHTATVQLLFQSGLSTDSVYITRSMIEDAENFLSSLQNTQIITQDNFELLDSGKIHRIKTEADRQVVNARGIVLAISKTRLITASISIGKNENGREMFSLNAAIAYYIIGNNIVVTPTNTEDDDATEDEESADSSTSNDNSDLTDNLQED